MMHVVLHARIGEALLSEDEETRSLAEHALVGEFARVACLQIQDDALPGSGVSRMTDELEFLRYCVALPMQTIVQCCSKR